VPTELVETFSSQIYFNHDSIDRQQRRASDLLKTIELDKKSFNLLDINPEEMHTVYSSHSKHVRSRKLIKSNISLKMKSKNFIISFFIT
jgi:hypothetical protein